MGWRVGDSTSASNKQIKGWGGGGVGWWATQRAPEGRNWLGRRGEGGQEMGGLATQRVRQIGRVVEGVIDQ